MAAERDSACALTLGRRPASMRPRPCGRGKFQGLGGVIGSTVSFNEAAAMWPRKDRDGGIGRDGRPSFNEAAAMWPRKEYRAL